MGAVWGRKLTLTIFGESHGAAIGGVIGGLPPGFRLNFDNLMIQMNRRRPGGSSLGTPRREKDEPEILSGLLNGLTTGAPLTFIIRNHNTKSTDYDRLKPICRPGHADYTAGIRYKGFHDLRGGGHFSGRLTAVLNFAGAVSRQVLAEKGIQIAGHISQIGHYRDEAIDYTRPPMDKLKALWKDDTEGLAVINQDVAKDMKTLIEQLRSKGDSVGGAVEVFAAGVPAGLGDHFFNSLESQLAALVFSVPAVKSVEFGLGRDFASSMGSSVNDCYTRDAQSLKVVTVTNNAGGILGGISSGMPVVMGVGFKPTPSIAQVQKTLNMETGEQEELVIEGRHDPCVVIRALPVVEACMAMVLLDELLLAEGYRN